MVATMMALTTLGIDAMLPALPAIGDTLAIPSDNDRQLVITAFLLGFAVAHLAYGPLADRFGRKPVLAFGLLGYAASNIVVALSGSFAVILIARAISGAAVAAARVVTVAIVRDCYSGRAMARVMSLAFILFMAAPVLAPSYGQVVLAWTDSWRWIFGGIAIVAALVLAWFWLRMPETLDPENRSEIKPARLLARYSMVLRDRAAVGYTLAGAAMMGGLFGFINSIQQIMFDVFDRPKLLVYVFATVAGTMAIASYVNSRIVMTIGTRRISHWALVGMIGFAAVHLAITASGHESLVSFALLQAAMMACFGLANANFSSMAMENMGAIAGTASSLQGFTMTLVGALAGAAIGQSFDGTTVPLYVGFLVLGLAALAMVWFAERGRLFRPS